MSCGSHSNLLPPWYWTLRVLWPKCPPKSMSQWSIWKRAIWTSDLITRHAFTDDNWQKKHAMDVKHCKTESIDPLVTWEHSELLFSPCLSRKQAGIQSGLCLVVGHAGPRAHAADEDTSRVDCCLAQDQKRDGWTLFQFAADVQHLQRGAEN